VITGASTAPTAITDITGAQAAITAIDSAIDAVNSQRATFGAVQNRFENVISNLMVASENQSAARSRIMDADYAAETSNLSRAQILQQAGNAMVAQANQLPQQVMSLLQR
jgi:flagellin